MNFIISFLIRFLSTDTIAKVFARLISRLLNIASKKGGKYWETTKTVVKKTRVWLDLFDQVYEDDEMTSEEEELVAKAIQNEVELSNVVEILKKQTKEVE